MTKKISLANKSRKNRMFFDHFIKELAICINTGACRVNRDIELPSYRGIQARKLPGVIDYGNNHAAVGFDTPGTMLNPKTLNALDNMLCAAKEVGLTHCNSRKRIQYFLLAHTDLTTCHLTAINDMYSLK